MSTAANNMPQAFGFGFNDEDIEDDGDREMPATINDGEPPDDTCETAKTKLHTLQEMV